MMSTSASSPLIIKCSFIISLFFVSTSAQTVWGFPGRGDNEEDKQAQFGANVHVGVGGGGGGLPGLFPGLGNFIDFSSKGKGDDDNQNEEDNELPKLPFELGGEEENRHIQLEKKDKKVKEKKPEKKEKKAKEIKPKKEKKIKPKKEDKKKLPKQPKPPKGVAKQPKPPKGVPKQPNKPPKNKPQPVPKQQAPPKNKPQPVPKQPEPPKILPQPIIPNLPEPPKILPNLPEPPKVGVEVGVRIGAQGLVVGAETNYAGKWEIVSLDAGVSAMHLQLMPTNKFVMFDASSLGKSNIELPPGNCRVVPNTPNTLDCYAHAVEYDLATDKVRTLKVLTNPWCSSGGLAPDGTLINTGGWEEGEKVIRYYKSCDTCDWKESNIKLSDMRWYGTQTMLADGRYVVLGGRRAFNYEFLAPEGQPSPGRIDLPFLFETTDIHENNLYPFVHLAPDGNLFILANYKSILLDVRTNKIIRKYPDLPGGARNYPGSATSAILPINLQNGVVGIDIEVLVCGGGQPLAFGKAEKEGIFLPALDTCGRIKVLDPKPNWEIEKMPAGRVMSDMLNLPNGDILILNGAMKGASGWQFADEPIFTPYLYSPYKPNGQRIKVLAPTTIARMYHSTSAVLPDGRIFVAGSNTNPGYQFQNVKFPTELRVEKFSPPYLDPALEGIRPKMTQLPNQAVGYGQKIEFGISIAAPGPILDKDIMVSLYLPPFTTHGYSMNQRLLILKVTSFLPQGPPGNFHLVVDAPPGGWFAPPGYYLLFANHRGVPSPAAWVQLH